MGGERGLSHFFAGSSTTEAKRGGGMRLRDQPRPMQGLGRGLHSHVATFIAEIEFLNVIGTKVLKSFPPCYSQSPLLKDFTPPPLIEEKWFETGLKLVCNVCKHCIRKPENSQNYAQKVSTKLYVLEFGFRISDGCAKEENQGRELACRLQRARDIDGGRREG